MSKWALYHDMDEFKCEVVRQAIRAGAITGGMFGAVVGVFVWFRIIGPWAVSSNDSFLPWIWWLITGFAFTVMALQLKEVITRHIKNQNKETI